jgi:hypothetical protein
LIPDGRTALGTIRVQGSKAPDAHATKAIHALYEAARLHALRLAVKL